MGEASLQGQASSQRLDSRPAAAKCLTCKLAVSAAAGCAAALRELVKVLLQQEQHKPNFVLSVLTQIVHSMPVAEGQKLALDATLTKFQKAVGTCERMVKTPIPRSYTR